MWAWHNKAGGCLRGSAQTGPAAANPLKATPGAQGRAAPARKLGFSLAKQ